jgi:hypothetical protein
MLRAKVPVPGTIVPKDRGETARKDRPMAKKQWSELSAVQKWGNRRMAKDHERLCATGEAFIHATMTRLMTRRLAHT